jgi:hypothetical protein
MPNALAYMVLFSWPVVAVILFRTMPLSRALIWTLLGGYLFLPTRPVIDLPVLPAIDKTLVPSLSALIGCWMMAAQGQMHRGKARVAKASPAGRYSRFAMAEPEATEGVAADTSPRRGSAARPDTGVQVMPKVVVYGIALLALIGAMLTTLTNADPVPAGPYWLSAMRAYDLGSMVMGLAVTLIPFFLARRYLAAADSQRWLLMAFAIGGLLYAPLMLIEVRLSPQLNVWLYGYFPHSFAQHVRGGGYRPIVFLEHGLWVGIFMAMATLSALALWRVTPRGQRPMLRLRWLILALGLLVVLVLAKSLGALMITLALAPVVLWGSWRLGVMVAVALAAVVLFYPMLRGWGLAPTDGILSLAQSISSERAGSFGFRLENEDVLLARAQERALFGWGGWGRGLLYDEWGNRTSVSDGAWIIVLGSFGWVGYLTQFGLLCGPILLLMRRKAGQVPIETVLLALILCANLVDLIPNATLEAITWMMAGAVSGALRQPVAARAPRRGIMGRTEERAAGSLARAAQSRRGISRGA